MSTSATLQNSLKQKMEELKEQLYQGNPNFETFQNVYNDLRKIFREFQYLLQWAVEDQRRKAEGEKFQTLYRQVAGWNASELMESLKTQGYRVKKNAIKENPSKEERKDKIIKEALDRQGYRILELVRSGKRDEVFHAILRIFISAKKEFPTQLVEAFKPVYSEELFKVFLFSFLSGILGKEEAKKEN